MSEGKEAGKNKNKLFVIVVVALLLGLTVYASYRVNAKDAVTQAQQQQNITETETGETAVENTGEPSFQAAGQDYFETFRKDRNDVREMELTYLDEIIAASASDDETLAEAQQQKLTLVSNMEKEFTIESVVKAKGFADAAVTFHTGSVNVVVDCEMLSAEQAAQILDIVQRETGESAANIKIVANG